MTDERGVEKYHQSESGRRRVIFTIVSANYIGFAATLMQSVRTHHPEASRFIILSDAHQEFPDVDLAAEVLGCELMGITLLENMKLWYTVIEFNTAIKPSCFIYFFEKLGFDEACYIDPDILLFEPLKEVFAAFPKHSCVLTPHMMHPLQDGKEPSDLTIMKSGVYNLGFLGLQNDTDGCRLAHWWADRCFANCRVDIPGNMFTDQRWMDLAPVFVERPLILRHPGYNVAYWNLANRVVALESDGKWTVNGAPLVFFHFSGIKPEDPTQFSKHTNRFTIDNLGVVAQLCAYYRQIVLRNKWLTYNKTRYSFGNFSDGRVIEDVMRHWIARMVHDGALIASERLKVDSDFFDEIDEVAGAKGAVLTRFMYQFWLDRKDLQDAFNVYNQTGLDAFFNWFLEDESVKRQVDKRSINAAARLRSRTSSSSSLIDEATPPKWQAVGQTVWRGPACRVTEFLSEDVPTQFTHASHLLPKQIALIWERRYDLQTAFKNNTVEDFNNFLAWAITQAEIDGCVDLTLLSEPFIDQMAAVSTLTNFYGDVPITAGMAITRKLSIGRTLGGWHQFPVERGSRLSHGLWFSFIAQRVFGWPHRFAQPVRDYFMGRTNIVVDNFRLSRGAISIWELRPDVQHTFPLSDRLSIWRFVRWLALFGLKELNVPISDFDPVLKEFLNSESPRLNGVTQLLEMLHDFRGDLKSAFDLTTESGREGLRQWAFERLSVEFSSIFDEIASNECPRSGSRSQFDSDCTTATIALTGQWSSSSGRGEDVRCSAKSLDACGFADYLIIDIEKKTVYRPNGELLEGYGRIHVKFNILHTNADTAFDNWQTLRNINVTADSSIGFWAWELESLPSYWRHSFSFYDEIWASTRFAADAFAKEDLRPVRLMPMAVLDPAMSLAVDRSRLNLPYDEVVFLFMFDFTSYASRKNPEAVAKAFERAFPDRSEKARLVIKTKGADTDHANWQRLVRMCSDPRIEIRDIRMDRSDLLGLVCASDAFVSLHRSEGFGRGPAEAMLLGVPTIVTNYSGTTDFATSECALLVDYELIQVSRSEYPGVENQRWADANIESAASHMRWVYENRAAAKALGKRARNQIRNLYDASKVGTHMLEAMGIVKDDFPLQDGQR